jgi:hypothetical protein
MKEVVWAYSLADMKVSMKSTHAYYWGFRQAFH